MYLALFNDWRLGAVFPQHATIVDITAALPWPHDPDPTGNGSWVRLCRDFSQLRTRLRTVAARGPRLALSDVKLRAPALNPTKIVAAASNYHDHVAEMRDEVMPAQTSGSGAWLLDFDVFLKAPSSLCGPQDTVLIPAELMASGEPVHHESELTVVIGSGGRNIRPEQAMDHVLGYTIGIDVTVRGKGDRSRRKSYDTFTPIGPWLTTADEVSDPHAIDINLWVGGKSRQAVNTSELIRNIPEIIAYVSRVMRLEPGDLIMTGAPPGVGPIRPGDAMDVAMTGLGRMTIPVDSAADPALAASGHGEGRNWS